MFLKIEVRVEVSFLVGRLRWDTTGLMLSWEMAQKFSSRALVCTCQSSANEFPFTGQDGQGQPRLKPLCKPALALGPGSLDSRMGAQGAGNEVRADSPARPTGLQPTQVWAGPWANQGHLPGVAHMPAGPPLCASASVSR